MQQPADFFCKEIVPGQHRLEAPILLLAYYTGLLRGQRVCLTTTR
jgi:hypothetical protein